MTPLLEQFLSETRDFLQSIGEKLMALESAPEDGELMVELFRLVHTLKGNSGLFDFPEMTRVLHAAEDLMDAVRDGRIPYSQTLADSLLDAMDFVGRLCDEIEETSGLSSTTSPLALQLAGALRAQLDAIAQTDRASSSAEPAGEDTAAPSAIDLSAVPETSLMSAYVQALHGVPVFHLTYTPDEQCFFQGDDPLFSVRQLQGAVWTGVSTREPWPDLIELDAYRCVLKFDLLVCAQPEAIAEHFRYVPDQIVSISVTPEQLLKFSGNLVDPESQEEDIAIARELLIAGDVAALSSFASEWLGRLAPDLYIASALRWLVFILDNSIVSPDVVSPILDAIVAQSQAAPAVVGLTEITAERRAALAAILATQRTILRLSEEGEWHEGRVRAVAKVLGNCALSLGDSASFASVSAALEHSLALQSVAPLLAVTLTHETNVEAAPVLQVEAEAEAEVEAPALVSASDALVSQRRVDDAPHSAKSLKVDQAKIDFLMNLIGEMVVAKNAMPYLAARAEEEFGMREMAREIKAQYAVINRIVEEMQGAIMQVRMMPVSFVFQRFPRLVRDLSRKLGKDVHLELEGEDTEADKNIIEALADPLIHIVRNSLDHGIEMPEVRAAAGKPAQGTLKISAMQEGDQAIIEITDDGKGIDPAVIRRKAYEKGIIDEAALERMSDKEAVNLIFAAGFSTADVVSDLSGRGVGMDVVRTAVEKVNGTIGLDSEPGKGTRIRISLPLSMAVTKVMIIESDTQRFGIPMEHVLETVRVPLQAVRSIKDKQVITLRGAVTPLVTLNDKLSIYAEPKLSDDGELAVLVTRVGGEAIGLVVDDFHESVDVIQKPLEGVLGALSMYSGSALMGNGSVLMVLNVKELV